jgi:hypothetical protein
VAGAANIVAAIQPPAAASIIDDIRIADFMISSGLFSCSREKDAEV